MDISRFPVMPQAMRYYYQRSVIDDVIKINPQCVFYQDDTEIHIKINDGEFYFKIANIDNESEDVFYELFDQRNLILDELMI